jgi:hypothetical protein
VGRISLWVVVAAHQMRLTKALAQVEMVAVVRVALPLESPVKLTQVVAVAALDKLLLAVVGQV